MPMAKRYLVDEGELVSMIKQSLENGMRISVMGRSENGSFIVSVYRPPPVPLPQRWSDAKKEGTKEGRVEKEEGVPPSQRGKKGTPESAKESASKRAYARTPEKGAPEGERKRVKSEGWAAYVKESLKAERRSS